jgi:hypothetical protein
MTCASVTIRLRGLIYVNLANQSVTYVSGTFVTLDSGLNTSFTKGGGIPICQMCDPFNPFPVHDSCGFQVKQFLQFTHSIG